MEETIKRHPVRSCAVLFTVCGFVRLIEYFAIRTDETIFSENFLHKIFGIILLAWLLHGNWQSIGFARNGIGSGVVKGLIFGCCCFIAAYSIECLILYCVNQNVSLSFYISGFSLNGETVKHSGIFFLLLCIVFNMINV